LLMAATIGGAMRTSSVGTATTPGTTNVSITPGGTAVTPPPSTLVVGGRGLEAGPRQLVMQGMLRARPLEPARQQMLEALLADSGIDLFPFDPSSPSVTSQTVANNVSESGQLPSADARPGPDYFVLANGRLEL